MVVLTPHQARMANEDSKTPSVVALLWHADVTGCKEGIGNWG